MTKSLPLRASKSRMGKSIGFGRAMTVNLRRGLTRPSLSKWKAQARFPTERRKVDQFYTLPQVAKKIGVTRMWVYKLVRRRKIKAVRFGRDYLVRQADIDRYLKTHTPRRKRTKV